MLRLINFIKSLHYFSLLFFMACSGGTGGTGENAGGKSVVVGTITHINASPAPTAVQQVSGAAAASVSTVTINGIQFDVQSSSISFDGVSGTDADLRIGMVATVNASIDSANSIGTAHSLVVNEAIKGPVTAIDTTGHTLTVLGQTIQTSAATYWDNVADIGGIAINNIIEVSGYVKNNSAIAATRVERLSDTVNDYKVSGSVSNLGVHSAASFTLGTLLVDFSSADLSAVTNGVLSNGMYVEVNGALTADTLVATRVSDNHIEINNAYNFELQGFITSTTGSPVTSFEVNHQLLQIDSNTRFSGGAITDIVPGVSVHVKGSLVNGLFSANLVAFGDTVNISGVVNSVNPGSFSLIGLGELSVSGDASTEFDGGILNMSELQSGYTVSIHGNQTSPNTVTATQISLESVSPSVDVLLQGPVETIAAGQASITLLGTIIDTASNTSTISDSDFVVEGVATNSRNYFFSVIATGDILRVNGTLTDNVITWNSISYEPPSN